MSALSRKLQEAHFCSLESQSNVYGLAKFRLPCGSHKILVAPIRGNVVSMEFQKARPLSKEVHFTYVPGDAEKICIDAFNKSYGYGVVVGIAFTKLADGKQCHFLNIYSDWESWNGKEYNLDSLAQHCNTVELSFLPYHLTHAELDTESGPDIVFLLSGNDQQVHLFREDKYLHVVQREPIEENFPELVNLPGNVTNIHCESLRDNQRLTACGFINGYIMLTLVDSIKREILKSWTVQHDSAITSLQIFTINTNVEVPHFVRQAKEALDKNDGFDEQQEYNLLVTSALEVTLIYRNIIEQGLSDPIVLRDSDKYDVVLCGCASDIDFDGQNEILLGTYGQELLVYKFHHRGTADVISQRSSTKDLTELVSAATIDDGETNKPENSKDQSTNKVDPGKDPGVNRVDVTRTDFDDPGRFSLDRTQSCPTIARSRHSSGVENPERLSLRSRQSSGYQDGEFRLSWQRSFPEPIFALDALDVTGDGLNEITLLSLKGLHVLQHDLREAARLCLSRMKEVTHQSDVPDDIFHQLLSENLDSRNQSDDDL